MIAPSSKRERKGERVKSVQRSEFGQDARMEVNASVASTVRAGVLGGLAGGVSIWIYEAIVWVGVQRMIPLDQIPRSAIGPVLGRAARDSPGALAYILGTGMHFFLCFAWGVLFAFLWPYFRQRGYEATLVVSVLCRVPLDRGAFGDRAHFLGSFELPRSERRHRRDHGAFLLYGPARFGRKAPDVRDGWLNSFARQEAFP